MHEFIIPISILVLVLYIVFPRNTNLKKLYEIRAKKLIAIFVIILMVSELITQGLFWLFIITIFLLVFLVDFIADEERLLKVIILFALLLSLAIFLKLNFIAKYLGAVFYIILVFLVSKNIVYEESN